MAVTLRAAAPRAPGANIMRQELKLFSLIGLTLSFGSPSESASRADADVRKTYRNGTTPPSMKSFLRAADNARKLNILFQDYVERHQRLPQASRWIAQLRPFARARHYDLAAMLVRSPAPFQRKFVMNAAVSNLGAAYIAEGEDVIVFYEMPVSLAGKANAVPLEGRVPLSQNGYFLFGTLESGDQTVYGAQAGAPGPCLTPENWNSEVLESRRVARVARQRQKTGKIPQDIVREVAN